MGREASVRAGGNERPTCPGLVCSLRGLRGSISTERWWRRRCAWPCPWPPRAQAGGETRLDKKDRLKEDDKGYKPGKGTEKIDVPFADKIFEIITDARHKVYKLKLKKGDKVVIAMHSDDMDSVVVVEDAKITVLALNDDDPEGGGTLDSRQVWTAPADDEYHIIATNLDKKAKGDFMLKVTRAK